MLVEIICYSMVFLPTKNKKIRIKEKKRNKYIFFCTLILQLIICLCIFFLEFPEMLCKNVCRRASFPALKSVFESISFFFAFFFLTYFFIFFKSLSLSFIFDLMGCSNKYSLVFLKINKVKEI